jgi:hypothetical protein
VAPVKPVPVMVTMSLPSALPLAGETAVTQGAVDGDAVGDCGSVGRGDMPEPDGDTGDAQGCVAPTSPPTPWVEQFGALLPPALGVTDPLPPALGVADALPPALEIVIVELGTVALPHATQTVATTTAPAAVRITDTGCRACHARRSPVLRRIHPISPPPLAGN